MKIEVFFTNNHDEWEDGCDHLINGGIWVRQYRVSGKKVASIYSLDKVQLSEFSSVFKLKKMEVDVPISGKGYFLKVYSIKIWGKKLDEIISWQESKQEQ